MTDQDLPYLNMDDPYHTTMAEVTSADIVTYSLEHPQATAYAHSISEKNGKTEFIINYKKQSLYSRNTDAWILQRIELFGSIFNIE